MKHIEYLKNLLSIDSSTSNIEGVNTAVELVMEWFNEFDLVWNKIPCITGANFLIGKTKEFNKSKPAITLSLHLDTVLHAQEINVHQSEGKIYGAGAQDVKGSVAAIYLILKKLKEQNKLQNITLAFSPEEEIATINHRETIKKIADKSDYILIFEPTLNSEPKAHVTKRSVVTQRRGIQVYNLEVKSIGGHSGVLYKKEDRKNSILALSELILMFENLADYSKRTTFNPGLINGGKAFNVIAPDAALEFEVRFSDNNDFARIDKQINELVKEYNYKDGFSVLLQKKLFSPAFVESEENNKLLEICKNIAKQSGIEFEIEHRGGGSEASLFKYFNPNITVLDGFGIRGDFEHTVNEYVLEESIELTADFDSKVILQLLN